MTDHPRFQKPKSDFDRTYREHHGAPLVDLVLRTADAYRNRGNLAVDTRARVLQTASVLLVLLCVLGLFAYALAHRDQLGAAPLYQGMSPPVPWAADATPRYGDQPSALPGKFTGFQGPYLP